MCFGLDNMLCISVVIPEAYFGDQEGIRRPWEAVTAAGNSDIGTLELCV
jgi:hypothetical protein